MELTIVNAVNKGIRTLGAAVDAEIAAMEVMKCDHGEALAVLIMNRYAEFPATRDYLIADLYQSIVAFNDEHRNSLLCWETAVVDGDWPVVLDD